MRGLLAYSGIAAKVRAMEGKLLDQEEWKNMATLETVSEAAAFLQTFEPYRNIFRGLDEESLHRGAVERLLTDSLYRDFEKLYRFSNPKQRRFLDFYFLHFETDILKSCLRNAVAHEPVSLGLARHEAFFKRHSKVDFLQLSASLGLEEYIENLEGTAYYSLFKSLWEAGDADQFDYEMALDLYYFKEAYGKIKKTLPKAEQKRIFQYFGTGLDLLNLQWIYRTKRYYAASTQTIQRLLIPLHCNLKKEQLERLVKAETVEDFFLVLADTYYGVRLRKADLAEKPDLEVLYRFVLNHMHRKGRKQNPYSMSILYSYLYLKEAEIGKITTIIESIRYQLNANEIITYMEQQY